LKIPTGSVLVYKLETEKIKPKKTGKKPGQTGFCLKKPNRTNRFEPVSVKKKFDLVIFFYKNQTEQKIITPNKYLRRRIICCNIS
jgi:hypothetical protein